MRRSESSAEQEGPQALEHMPHEQSEGEEQGKEDVMEGEKLLLQQQGVKSVMLRSVSVPCDLASLPAEQQARLHWQMHRQHNRSAIQDLFCGECSAAGT